MTTLEKTQAPIERKLAAKPSLWDSVQQAHTRDAGGDSCRRSRLLGDHVVVPDIHEPVEPWQPRSLRF